MCGRSKRPNSLSRLVSMTDSLQSWRHNWLAQRGRERSLQVRWLLNPNESPLENVEIIECRGRITEIRPIAATTGKILPVIAIPPLVNPHTHLEFSKLLEPISPALPFQDWISAIVQWRRSDGTNNDGVTQGLAESIRSGVTVIGEITTTQTVKSGDISNGSSVVSFREILGLQHERIPDLLRLASEHLSPASTAGSNSKIIRGISPHAPYTVHPELFAALIDLAVDRNAVVAMHLAETQDELELLHDGKGGFVDFLSKLGLWHPKIFPGGRSIREFLDHLAQVPRALAIHGNCFSTDDIRFLGHHQNIATVYCPRTHAFFKHPEHPFRHLLSAGARVILGTDSRASNPDLSIWKELQHVATHFPEVTIQSLLAMVTTDAADAMGLPQEKHRINMGCELSCVLLNAKSDATNLRQLILNPSTQPTAVIIGEVVLTGER
jgi:cytosine/adenosine deaminase-related metal-dependent hydrolase